MKIIEAAAILSKMKFSANILITEWFFFSYLPVMLCVIQRWFHFSQLLNAQKHSHSFVLEMCEKKETSTSWFTNEGILSKC